jgi:hypothetical protein
VIALFTPRNVVFSAKAKPAMALYGPCAVIRSFRKWFRFDADTTNSGGAPEPEVTTSMTKGEAPKHEEAEINPAHEIVSRQFPILMFMAVKR